MASNSSEPVRVQIQGKNFMLVPTDSQQQQSRPTMIYRPGMIQIGNDDEFSSENPFNITAVRNQFVRKVFTILTGQMVLTFMICLIVFLSEDIQKWLVLHLELLLIALAIYTITAVALFCFPQIRRNKPVTYTLILVTTLCCSIILSYSTIKVEPVVLLTAVGITLAITITLVVFAMQTRFDFTAYVGVLSVMCIGIVGFGIIVIFFPTKTMNMMYSLIVVIFVAICLVVDIQMILLGKHQYSFGPDDAPMAALCIYLDIVVLFMHILRLLKSDD